MTTLVLEFKKIGNEDKTKYSTFYLNLNSKVETIINESDINDVFESIYSKITLNIQKPLGKGLGWTLGSVVDHNINMSKYSPLPGSSYIKLTKQLNHPKKHFINIQNIDGIECFKWCLVIYLHPADHHLARIRN